MAHEGQPTSPLTPSESLGEAYRGFATDAGLPKETIAPFVDFALAAVDAVAESKTPGQNEAKGRLLNALNLVAEASGFSEGAREGLVGTVFNRLDNPVLASSRQEKPSAK